MKEGTGGHYGIINVEISTNKFPDIIESEEGEQSSSGKWQYKAGVGVRGCPDQALEKCKTQMVEDVNPCICNGQYSANDSYKQLVKICVLQKC